MTWTMGIFAVAMCLIAVAPGVHAGDQTSVGPSDACVAAGTDLSSISVNPGYCAETGMGIAREIVGS